MNKLRRHLCASIAIATSMSLGPTGAMAQEAFPNKPVRIIVAYTAGTGSDVVGRIVAQALSPILGQSVIIDNRPGAGGMLGTEQGAKSPPDGYTLTLASAGALIIAPAMSRNPPRYNVDKDFIPIGGLARSAFVVVTANTPEAPHTFQELLSRVKEKGGNFGSPGTGTTTHLVGEVVLHQAGVKAQHVPYRGTAQSLVDTAAGQVGFAFDTVAGALPLVRGGKLRALAVSSAERIASMPGVPTLSEAGMPGYSIVSWWGLLAPVGTPPDVVKKLSDALLRALDSPEVKKSLAAQELEPYPLASAAYTALIRKETPMWTDLVKENKLVSD
jgi:tripartite-type tricarboxylate transporter receptor subunit TctC